jgi:hypothetical protein
MEAAVEERLVVMSEIYCVFVVLDGDYGERLSSLADAGPVWIIDTHPNRVAAQKFWNANPNRNHLDGVTAFKFPQGNSTEDILINELETIDLHHGIYSANPPYTVLEAIGVSLSDKLRAKFSEFDFNRFEVTAQGFRASRPLPVVRN